MDDPTAADQTAWSVHPAPDAVGSQETRANAASHGRKVVAALALLLLIDSFFEWQGICADGICVLAANAWHDVGVLGGLALFALLIWEGMRSVGVATSQALRVRPAALSTLLGATAGLLMVVHFLVADTDRRWPAWAGLVLALTLVVSTPLARTGGSNQHSDGS